MFQKSTPDDNQGGDASTSMSMSPVGFPERNAEEKLIDFPSGEL